MMLTGMSLGLQLAKHGGEGSGADFKIEFPRHGFWQDVGGCV